MYTNPIMQMNMQKLKDLGQYKFIEPHEGVLAYGGTGTGELATVDEIADFLIDLIGNK